MNKEVINREKVFHDEWSDTVDPEKVKVEALANACTMPETRYILEFINKIGGLNGKKVLEIGCGCGEASVYFAMHGADVTATDISDGMVKLAKKVAECHNVKIRGGVCSADNLPFENSSFHIVYAANVLHHVDIEATLDEVKRVLKPGGYFFCWDPIRYNPAINIYRKLASAVRSVDEHPIDKRYLKAIGKHFQEYRCKSFWLSTCLIFVKYYFVDKIDPSKERYWKKVIDDAEKLEVIYKKLENIDRTILKLFPFLKWMCWNMVVVSRKEI